jgi:hypothetical protein
MRRGREHSSIRSGLAATGLTLFAAFVTACSVDPGSEEPRVLIDYLGPTVDAPEFAGFVDDEEKAEYCAERPDAAVCSGVGVIRQPWISAEYYGYGHDGYACFAPQGTSGECIVPTRKQFSVHFNYTACDSFIGTGSSPLTRAELTAIKDGFREGILSLHNLGTNVTVQTGVSDSNRQPFNVDCESGAMGRGGLEGNSHIQISNLPRGPSGQDEGAARQRDRSFATVNPRAVKAFGIGCGTPSTLSLRLLAQRLGQHEGLHAMGFEHFTTGIMKPIMGCEYGLASIPVQFSAVMSAYNGSSGNVTILDAKLLDATGQPTNQ